MAKITLTEEVKELKRELQLRDKLYTNEIRQYKMTKEVADFRIAIIESVISRLEDLEFKERIESIKKSGEQSKLF